jgi:hypothetical protein
VGIATRNGDSHGLFFCSERISRSGMKGAYHGVNVYSAFLHGCITESSPCVQQLFLRAVLSVMVLRKRVLCHFPSSANIQDAATTSRNVDSARLTEACIVDLVGHLSIPRLCMQAQAMELADVTCIYPTFVPSQLPNITLQLQCPPHICSHVQANLWRGNAPSDCYTVRD